MTAPEVKGRALLRATMRMARGVLLLTGLDIAAAFFFPEAVPFLHATVKVMSWAVIGNLAVVLAWNAQALWQRGTESIREVLAQAELNREEIRSWRAGMPQHKIMNPGGITMTEFVAPVEGWQKTVGRALAAGTLSINGVPYPGGRVSKSECEGCGRLLDIAWCTPDTPYLCPYCLMYYRIHPWSSPRPYADDRTGLVRETAGRSVYWRG
jgi:hypothetical protein